MNEPNVDRMLRSMSATQYQEWKIVSELEPWGNERDDYRSAQIVATMLNMWADRKAYPPHPNGWSVEECLVMFGDLAAAKQKPRVVQSVSEIEQALDAWIIGSNMRALAA